MVDYPLEDLGVGKFAGLGNIVEGGLALRDLLNLSRLEKRLGIVPVSKTLPGAFRSVEEAVAWGRRSVPETRPASQVQLLIDLRDVFDVNLSLPPTHGYSFIGLRAPNQTDEEGGIRGVINCELNAEAQGSPFRRPRLTFDRLLLGHGYSLADTLILQVRYGWRVTLGNLLAQGLWLKFFHDVAVTQSQAFIRLDVENIQVNQFFCVDYQEDARSTPGTYLYFRKSSLFADDTPHGTTGLPSFNFRGRISPSFENCNFLGWADDGTGAFVGKAACSGSFEFLNCSWDVLSFMPYKVFGPNLAGLGLVFWKGRNLFAGYAATFDEPIDLGGLGGGMVLGAPEVILGNTPLNPPLGTKRRDVGFTEKELFWNGAAWV